MKREYSESERRNVATVNAIFEAGPELDRLAAFAEDAVRQHTMRAKTHGGRDYTNVYCFVFRFDDAGRVLYLTEHWNTWHAERFLLDQWTIEPAHPLGGAKPRG